jgi:hypothetical protein
MMELLKMNPNASFVREMMEITVDVKTNSVDEKNALFLRETCMHKSGSNILVTDLGIRFMDWCRNKNITILYEEITIRCFNDTVRKNLFGESHDSQKKHMGKERKSENYSFTGEIGVYKSEAM